METFLFDEYLAGSETPLWVSDTFEQQTEVDDWIYWNENNKRHELWTLLGGVTPLGLCDILVHNPVYGIAVQGKEWWLAQQDWTEQDWTRHAEWQLDCNVAKGDKVS